MKRVTWLGTGIALAACCVLAVAPASSPGSSGTVLNGAGNGLGNRVSVSGASGTTVIQGSRLGVGNSIEVENIGSSVLIEDRGIFIDGIPVLPPNPAARSPWTQKVWKEELGDYLYWSAKTKGWYRYHPGDRAYYPLEVYPQD